MGISLSESYQKMTDFLSLETYNSQSKNKKPRDFKSCMLIRKRDPLEFQHHPNCTFSIF